MRFFRLAIFLSVTTILGLGAVVMPSSFAVADVNDPARDLRVQLRDGLKASRDAEYAFVDRVVLMVEEKRLPLDMVDSIYTYARNRNPRIPFPYFERALRLVAAQKGIQID